MHAAANADDDYMLYVTEIAEEARRHRAGARCRLARVAKHRQLKMREGMFVDDNEEANAHLREHNAMLADVA